MVACQLAIVSRFTVRDVGVYSRLVATLGEIIKARRAALRWTQRKLAAEVGVSHTYIYNLENGKNDIPSPDVMAKFASVLQVAEETLLQSVGYLKDKATEAQNTYNPSPIGPDATWREVVDAFGGDEDAARRFLVDLLGKSLE